ncbi:winged helix DNA-binding domain-containing protein [Kribbella sp. NPDC051770]|uniref:winged helix DNA-binding domain-containing protein n=1 Tax=Kribbella sp. NPDC051770 TaxID=3155413 RepID=UPI00341EE5CA
MDVMDRRALNRATLARQFLLAREQLPALDAVHALAGLNAQSAKDPYLGLWARLTDFEPDQLADLLHDKQVVRACLMRYTQHLVTAADYQILRPVIAPVLVRAHHSAWRKQTEGVDLDELVVLGKEALKGVTLTRPQLGKKLKERWPDHEGTALGWTFQYLASVVHPPPDGLWGRKGGVTPFALAEDWLGITLGEPDPGRLILLYLAAFGPASLRDIHAWSGLSRLGDTLDELRPQLVTFTNEAGTELFDLPDAPRPDPSTPVPVRLLPEFDNLMVGFRDRSRVMTKEQQTRVCVGAYIAATLLVDGFVRGMWKVELNGDTATLAIELLDDNGGGDVVLSAAERKAVEAEGIALLRFMAPGQKHRVQLV